MQDSNRPDDPKYGTSSSAFGIERLAHIKCNITRSETFFFNLLFPLQALELFFGKKELTRYLYNINTFLNPDSVTSYTSALRIYGQLIGVTMGGRQVTTIPASCVTCQGRCRTRKKSKKAF